MEVEEKYLDDLRAWVLRLDQSRGDDKFLYEGESSEKVWPRYYFGYGTDLSRVKMTDFYPEHKFVCLGTALGKQLVVVGDNPDRPHMSFGEKDGRSCIKGHIYLLSEHDERMLDEREKESGYEKTKITVEVAHGGEVKCFAFRFKNDESVNVNAEPVQVKVWDKVAIETLFKTYIAFCREAGLSTSYLQEHVVPVFTTVSVADASINLP